MNLVTLTLKCMNSFFIYLFKIYYKIGSHRLPTHIGCYHNFLMEQQMCSGYFTTSLFKEN